ncbi:MAG: hypothetical protein IBX47_09000 [Desulfuromonadales bacterium]|nr:hypothetical protein [Desulfuromonadales bacterium]
MKKMIMVLFVLLFCASMLQAQESAEAPVSFWEMIRTKIENVTPQKKPAVTTAVGGVRGARSDSGEDLYWKGEPILAQASEQELESFKEALTRVEAGELEHGQDLFEKFVVDYPESIMKDDALLALQEIRTQQAAKLQVTPAQ